MKIYPLTKTKTIIIFIYSNYNDEGSPDSVGSSLFAASKKCSTVR